MLEGCNVSVIGQNVDLTYPYNYLGKGASELGDALKDEEFVKSFKDAKFPVVLVGPGILKREDRNTILQQVSLRHCSSCNTLRRYMLATTLHLQATRSTATAVGRARL